jgi:hypothetical protein
MKLALPNLTVIDRAVPYRYTHVDIPIFEEDASRAREAAQLDFLQIQAFIAGPQRRREMARATSGDDRASRLDRILRLDVGSRFILAPGDPSPFVWRDVGAVDCGALSGMAAVHCAVMSRR